MLLDYTDIELLRVTGWCRNLPADIGRRFPGRIFESAEFQFMQELGLIYGAASGDFYRLRPAGFALLSSLGLDCPRDSKYISDEKTLLGRRKAAEIMLAFYRAGFHIFPDTPEQLKPLTYLSYATIRRNSKKYNPFPGLNLVGIARDARQALACYYPDEGNLCMGNETTAIEKLSGGMEHRSLLFCGSTYLNIAQGLLSWESSQPPRRNGTVSYPDAYRKSPYPVCLLECSDTGAAQLLLTAQAGYRTKLARLALGGRYSPPSSALKFVDAMYQDAYPVLIGVDMDVERIKTVCQSVRQQGYSTAIAIAFREQLPALAELCASIRPELFGTGWREALQHMGQILYDPPEKAYLTKEGGCINAASVKAVRKAGKPFAAKGRKKAQAPD